MEELQLKAHSVSSSRSVLFVNMVELVDEQVDECNLRKKPNGDRERIEQEKNPQDDAGLLSFAFFWYVVKIQVCLFDILFLGGFTPC